MDTIPMDIVRAAPIGVDLRADEDSRLMEVRFAPFNNWYEVHSWWEGDFVESIARGAFKKTMQESGSRVKVMFNHGHDFHIGEKLLGVPSNLREESDSPVGDVELFDTSYNRDLIPGIRAGAYGASFMFRVIKEEWNEEPGRSDHNPEGIPERTIKEVRLLEFGPVTWPANPAATSGMRSMTDEYYEQVRTRDARRVEQLAARVQQLRTPVIEQSGEPTVDDVDVASEESNEPQEMHSGGMTPRERRERIYPYLRSK